MYINRMNRINYQHLYYFWVVAREGTIAKACMQLHLTQPTISTQLQKLEKSLGTKLFNRHGRNIALSDSGRLVFSFANEIFSLGRELQGMLLGKPTGTMQRLVIGVADVLPKMIVYKLLEPALRLAEPVQIICHDDKTETLLARLALNELDVVLSDIPASPLIKIKAYNHLLGESSISILGTQSLVNRYRRGFPQSLNAAPFLLPMEGTSLRRSLDEWFDANEVRPRVVGVFGDCDLFEVFGREGTGFFAVPSLIERHAIRQNHVKLLGRADSISEKYYAISVEKRLKHPAVVAITDSARKMLTSEDE